MDIAHIWSIFCTLSGIAVGTSLCLYLLPFLYFAFLARPQNLRKKYGLWAVVTGGSSGIGKALVHRLASQGVNVVIVALDNTLLVDTISELRTAFPTIQFRSVGADLGRDPQIYMKQITQATDDIAVSMLFSNAGFLRMAFFHRRSAEEHAANIECNSVAGLRIIHHFYSRMIDEGIRGCIAITSSSVSYMPAPFASIYGASKAMLTHLFTSVAIEAEQHGIDMTIINPSYTQSNLYEGAPKVGVLAILSKFAWTPESVAAAVFASVGRTVVRDLGAYSAFTNIIGRLIDHGALAQFIIPFRDSMAPPEETAERPKAK